MTLLPVLLDAGEFDVAEVEESLEAFGIGSPRQPSPVQIQEALPAFFTVRTMFSALNEKESNKLETTSEWKQVQFLGQRAAKTRMGTNTIFC